MFELLKQDMSLEDCIVFVEGISNEMKEKGQKEMWKQYSDILYKLNSYFINKWNKKKNKRRFS